MELFRLVGKIMVDSAEAQSSISKTGEKAEGLGSKLASGIKSAAKWATGVTAAASAVGTAIVAAAKNTAEAADTIDKGAIRMGISTDAYQELAYAAGLSAVEMSTLEAAAQKLEGTDLNFDEAITQLMALTDEEERSRAAAELFGEETAYKMAPLLQAGAEGLQSMRDEAHDLGLVMSEDAVKGGADMGDMMSKVEQSVAALKTGIATELMPYAIEILRWVVDELPKITATLRKVMDAIMPIVKPILDAVMGIVSAFFDLIDGDFEGFATKIKDSLIKLGTALFEIGKKAFSALWDGIKGVWSSITGWVSEKVEWLKDKLMFWKKSSDSMTVDGSHASGLPYVPYDGYRAELHRGESVLTADATASLADALRKIADGGAAQPQQITIQIGDETISTMLVKSMREELRMA